MTQSEQLKRNATCPCNSGKRYKHCCGNVALKPKLPPIEEPSLPAGLIEAANKLYENVRRQKEWQLFHGETLPAATALWQGTRVVSAGSHLYKVAVEESWYGFLYGLLIEQIGPDWFDAEMAKPEGSAHFLAQWYCEICRRERDENGHFTRYDPANEVGTTLAFRSIAYDIFCMMQAINLSPKLIDRLRHLNQFEGARYELWVAATLVRAGFSIEFADEDDRSSKHGEGIATHRETGKKYWIEAKRKHRPAFDYLQALIDKLMLKVDAKLVAAAMQKPAEDCRLIFIDVNRPPWSRSDIKAPWIGAFRKSLNILQLQKDFRENPDQCAFVMVTNHPYHFVSNLRPDPKQHFFGTAFNMSHFNPVTLEADFPEIYMLMRSITDHFAIPPDFLESPNVAQG
jgi:SEC-C motif